MLNWTMHFFQGIQSLRDAAEFNTNDEARAGGNIISFQFRIGDVKNR